MKVDYRELKILLRLPNWLGDSVMCSIAFEELKKHFPNAVFSIVGTNASCGIYERDYRIKNIFIDSTKKSKNRFFATNKLAKEIGKHDIAISFSNTFFSALLMYLTKTGIRIGYAKNLRGIFLTKKVKFIKNIHQVLSYLNLVNELIDDNLIEKNINPSKSLKLISMDIKGFNKDYSKRYIGINPGASYGSAKRWEEKYFLEIIMNFLSSKDYVVFLFGNDDLLNTESINNKNFINLTNKTSITKLCDYISMMDLFITNDSGPMHIAASLNIPIIAMFGPTDSNETSPWNAKAILLNKHLPCSPCKKRICPLKHHNCMKLITPDEVIENAYKLLNNITN
ncbi:lipopolysaccharide heptosyltransferase II [Helicobacter sp. MIT 14-3879]|uniref:lipopolysaccharide heptosyltransferase II n=1 Tax=Helicobacter sp. MIT 14-3879 TaxID=2040649 RepID=UPI000E1EA596|nr:lipopolysaccharide heptosyltransferase II [Helicobacter sp. MIT 14-3879]RDU62633.1 lipopolysaccharide heptosyltransferase II [Helicobacter sp. MIT 14-3879]